MNKEYLLYKSEKKSLINKKYFFLSFILLMFVLNINVFSQSPGMIFYPVPSGSPTVLDPNGDGYVSKAIFSPPGFPSGGNDETDSEIPYLPIVFPAEEPPSDLGPGPNCGFTDFVQQTAGVEDAAQYYLDGSNNWLFRFRMGGTAPNSKSYSVLIDTDGKFGATGPNKDPSYTTSNPGFEIEIVLATNFGVYIYNVDPGGTGIPNCTPVKSYGTDHYQKAIALSTTCTAPANNVFYDMLEKTLL